MDRVKLGILGGMGPEATEIFYKKIIAHTMVEKDQDHIDILIYSHAGIPDRTGYLLSGREEELWKVLEEDVELLKSAGIGYLVIPCNTTHYFADRFNALMDGKFINMVEETACFVQERHIKRVGILATDGTIRNDMYGAALRSKGIEAVYPSPESQRKVMSIIYDEIKSGEKGDRHKFNDVVKELEGNNCEACVLACTELSVFSMNHMLGGGYYVDALDVAAKVSIEKCGGTYQV